MKYFKKMRNLFFTLCFCTSVYGQVFFVGTHHGYGVPFLKTQLGREVSVTGDTTRYIYGSYGGGWNFNVEGGYMFNEHFGVALNISYLLGKRTITNNIQFGFTEYREDYVRLFTAHPMFLARTGGEKIRFIGKMGFVVPFAGYQITEAFSGVKDVNNPTVVDSAALYLRFRSDGRPTFGTVVSLGAEYSLSDNLALFAEANFVVLNVKSYRTKLEAYKQFGVDKYPYWEKDEQGNDTGNRYVVTGYDENKSTPEAGKGFTVMSPYSSARFNLGVRFYFSR